MNILRKIYGTLRGHDLGDNVSFDAVVSLGLSKLPDLLRGTLYRCRYKACAGMHFRGAGTRTIGSRYISLGRHVAIGPYAQIQGYSEEGILIGDGVTIGAGSSILGSAVIREPGVGVSIGRNVSVGIGNVIWGQGGVNIGEDTLLGPYVTIVSENHEFEDISTPIRMQGFRRSPVSIGANCWIGAGAKIMPGVTIGNGCVVGAGSVVTRSLPDNSVSHGVPARVSALRK